MYTIHVEKYHNDSNVDYIKMSFPSLDALFQYLKDISHNFSAKYGNYFPTRESIWKDYSEGYDWCDNISVRNGTDSYFDRFWIHQIDNADGIIYSDGCYTKGEKFCAKSVEDWLKSCQQKRSNNSPCFVEDNNPGARVTYSKHDVVTWLEKQGNAATDDYEESIISTLIDRFKKS